jgi:uncharacterized protein YkwD
MESRRGFLLGLAALPLSLSAKTISREPLASIEQRVFQAINFQRISVNAEPLVWSDPLGQTARVHSARMLEGRFFGHDDPKYGDLSARLTAAGVGYWRCGENVFREKNYDDPVAIAIVQWMYSDGHRRNLLLPEYTHTGVGVAVDVDGTVAVTQQFLTPPPRQ